MKHQVVSCVIAGIGFGSLAYFLLRKKRNPIKIPNEIPPVNSKWVFIGTVKELTLFPLQSGAALTLSEAECGKFGLQTRGIRDRGLVLLTEEGKRAFAGRYPVMLSITTEIENESTVILRAPNMDSMKLDIDQLVQGEVVRKVKKCKGFKLHLIECEQKHHEWFSQVIFGRSNGVRLFISQEPEIVHNIRGEDKSEFNPLMIMNDKSVADLNSRLTKEMEVHHLQFRGNILLECDEFTKAYEEDNWNWLKIGDSSKNGCILEYRGPCLRCILPNVDIKTFKRNVEPLKTLNSYRRIHHDKEPTMGAYFTVHKEGKVHVNDPVYVLCQLVGRSG